MKRKEGITGTIFSQPVARTSGVEVRGSSQKNAADRKKGGLRYARFCISPPFRKILVASVVVRSAPNALRGCQQLTGPPTSCFLGQLRTVYVSNKDRGQRVVLPVRVNTHFLAYFGLNLGRSIPNIFSGTR